MNGVTIGWRATLRRTVRITRQRSQTVWIAWLLGLAWVIWRHWGWRQAGAGLLVGLVLGAMLTTCAAPLPATREAPQLPLAPLRPPPIPAAEIAPLPAISPFPPIPPLPPLRDGLGW